MHSCICVCTKFRSGLTSDKKNFFPCVGALKVVSEVATHVNETIRQMVSLCIAMARAATDYVIIRMLPGQLQEGGGGTEEVGGGLWGDTHHSIKGKAHILYSD